MCPYTAHRDLDAGGDRRFSGGKKEAQCLISLPPRHFTVKAEDLCGLIELGGRHVRDRIDADYGSPTGLCTELHTSVTEGIVQCFFFTISSFRQVTDWVIDCTIDRLIDWFHHPYFLGIVDDPSKLQRRTLAYGSNVIPMKKPKTFLQLMLQALKEPTLIILEAAAVLSLALSVWNIFRPGGELNLIN